jgi:hypothetical protein
MRPARKILNTSLLRPAGAGLVALVLLVTSVWGPTSQALGVTSGTVVANDDRRFDAVAGVTLTQWRGINNVFGNATLIAPDRVIMPRHLINRNYTNRRSVDGAPTEYTIRFRRALDGTVGNISNPASFHHVRVREWIFPAGRKESDDVVIGILESPVTHITPATVDLRTKPSKNAVVSIASWGPVANQTTTPVAKGTLLSGMMRLASADSNKIKLTVTGRTALPLRVVNNDSGAPLLIMDAAGPRIIGFVTTPNSGVAFRQLDGSRLFPRARR